MVHPLLNGSLHLYLHQPVHVVGRGFIVRRLLHQVVDFLLRVAFLRVNVVHAHPLHELRMINNIFLVRVAHLVNKVHMHVGVARIHLAAAFIHRHEHRLNAAGGLRHEACGARGGHGETGYVAAPILRHIGIQLGVGLLEPADKRILLLALSVVNLKGSALLGHLHRRAVGSQRQRAMNIYRKIGGLLRAIAKSHGSYHVALGCDANACAAAHAALALNLFPKVIFGLLHLFVLRVRLHLLHDLLYLLQLQIHNVVHQPLGNGHMLAEQIEVEARLLRKRVHHIRIKVDAQQTARVVGAQRYLATRIGAHRAETQVGITVGNALAQNGIPKQHTRLCALPCIVNNLGPQILGINGFAHVGILRVDGELLHVLAALGGSTHKLVVNLHTHVGTRHLALGHLRIDESLSIGMLDAHAQH